MNWGLVLGIVLGALLLGLIWLLKGGFLILLIMIIIFAIGAGIMWMVYNWVFPPGWDK